MSQPSYPTTCRYHAEHGKKEVKTAEQEQALGPGWFDTPNIHEKLLLNRGESSESRARREGEIRQACKACDQRLEKRASEEQPLRNGRPLVCFITVDSLEKELKELAFGVTEIYLRDWAKCDQSMDSQEDTWFRKSFVGDQGHGLEDTSVWNSVRTLLKKKLLPLKQDYGKQMLPREKVDQRCEQLDKVGASVYRWAREKAGLGGAKTTRPEDTKKGAEAKPKRTFSSPGAAHHQEAETGEAVAQKAAGSAEQGAETTATNGAKEFTPRELGKGTRGKLIGIALSGHRADIKVKKIVARMGKTKATCPSTTYKTFKDWYREAPQSFHNFLFRLREEGKKWEEINGQRIPDQYYEKYQ